MNIDAQLLSRGKGQAQPGGLGGEAGDILGADIRSLGGEEQQRGSSSSSSASVAMQGGCICCTLLDDFILEVTHSRDVRTYPPAKALCAGQMCQETAF